MYNLFFYNINKMSDELYESELEKLPRIRREIILKKHDISDRKRSLAGDILAKKYISKIFSVNKENISFAIGEHGKPYVVNVPAHFSISHSGNYTAIAISNKPIGLDIEMLREFSAVVAHRIFNKDELAYISGAAIPKSKSEMQRCFYEIWTAKEAYVKYTGQGLSGGISSLSFRKSHLANDKLVPLKEDIKLYHDFSVPGAVAAVILPKD